MEIQEEVYPGEFVTFWVFAPLGSAMNSAARLPSPTLRVEEGDHVAITLYNTHYLPHTIHLHGTSQPNDMDGVPHMTQHEVEPGKSFTYRFIAGEPGTYWYHCHVQDHVHPLMGLAGMLIIEPNRPHNHFAHLIPGAGRITSMAKATREEYQNEYSLVYMDIDDRLNRIPAAYSDPREIEKRMHRDYDSTQRKPNIFMLNGRSFPVHAARHADPGEAGRNHQAARPQRRRAHDLPAHPRPSSDADRCRRPSGAEGARVTRDTFDVGPAQRVDLALRTGSDGVYAAGPGVWLMHDHAQPAASNKGINPGGDHTAIVYEGFMGDDGLPKTPTDHPGHSAHARYFDPDYYRGEVPVFDPGYSGSRLKPTRRAGPTTPPAGGPFDYPTRAQQLPALPRLDLIDAERHRPVAAACAERPRSKRRIVVKAGRQYAQAGEVFAFEPRELRAERCEEVEIVLENTDEIRHDFMIPGLNPIFALNVIGPATASATFVTPDEDVTLFLHCHVSMHDRVGMVGKLIVGKGGEPKVVQAQAPDRGADLQRRRRRDRGGAARRTSDRRPRGDPRLHGRHGDELSGCAAVPAQRAQSRRQDRLHHRRGQVRDRRHRRDRAREVGARPREGHLTNITLNCCERSRKNTTIGIIMTSRATPWGWSVAVYDAFISYSHAKDKPIAAALQSIVQSLGKPWYRRRALRVFRDDTSLSATPSLWPSIEQALAQSRYLILMASPEAAASHWVNKEVAYWLEHKSVDTLLIALTDGDLAWDAAGGDFMRYGTVPLPPALTGRLPSEPKWIDLRPYRDGADPRDSRFVEAGADFAAAIHGMPKEDLLSQEVRQQRRALRLAWSAAGVLAGFMMFAAWQWWEADSAKKVAVAAEGVAQTQRSLAVRNFGIAQKASDDVLLGLAQELRSAENMSLRSRRRILDIAQQLMDRLVDASPDDLDLQRSRAIMLHEFAQTYLAGGDLTAASEAADDMLRITRKLLKTDPNNAFSIDRPPDLRRASVRKHDLSINLSLVADVRLAAGDRAAARVAADEALVILRELSAADPENLDLQRALATQLGRAGLLRLIAGDRAGAMVFYDENLAISRKLVEARPSDVSYQSGLSNILHKIGEVRADGGDRAGALAAFEDSLFITRQLVKFDPGNSSWQSDVAETSRQDRGVAGRRGRPSGSARRLRGKPGDLSTAGRERLRQFPVADACEQVARPCRRHSVCRRSGGGDRVLWRGSGDHAQACRRRSDQHWVAAGSGHTA